MTDRQEGDEKIIRRAERLKPWLRNIGAGVAGAVVVGALLIGAQVVETHRAASSAKTTAKNASSTAANARATARNAELAAASARQAAASVRAGERHNCQEIEIVKHGLRQTMQEAERFGKTSPVRSPQQREQIATFYRDALGRLKPRHC